MGCHQWHVVILPCRNAWLSRCGELVGQACYFTRRTIGTMIQLDNSREEDVMRYVATEYVFAFIPTILLANSIYPFHSATSTRHAIIDIDIVTRRSTITIRFVYDAQHFELQGIK